MSEKETFLERLFNENENIFKEYPDKEKAKKDLRIILCNLNFNLHLESEKGTFLLKDLQNYLPVKLGYYKILGGENKNPEMLCEQCTITPTEKGNEIFREYRKFSN